MFAAKHPGQPITLPGQIDEELTSAARSLRTGGPMLPLCQSGLEFLDRR